MTATVSLSPTAGSLLQYLQQNTMPNRYSSFSGKVLEAALGICRKSLQRARRALVAAGLLDYHVAGRLVYYRLLPHANGAAAETVNERSIGTVCTGDSMSMLQAMQQTIAMLEAQLRMCTAELARLQQCVAPQSAQTECVVVDNAPAVAPEPVKAESVLTAASSNEDVLFSNRYQQLLEPYLAAEPDPKYRAACMDHFRMMKAAYSRRGKRKLTEAGFHRIMQQLDTLCGTDTELRLAIMARSLRRHWTGFFALPHNTAEQKALDAKAVQQSVPPATAKKSEYKPSYSRSSRSSGPKYYETDDIDLSIFEE